MSVASAAFWDLDFQLNQYCINEILFWQKNLKIANVKVIPMLVVQVVALISISMGGQICHKQWDQHDITKSSTWRELSAIEFALSSFLPMIIKTYLKWFTDSQVACRIVTV